MIYKGCAVFVISFSPNVVSTGIAGFDTDTVPTSHFISLCVG